MPVRSVLDPRRIEDCVDQIKPLVAQTRGSVLDPRRIEDCGTKASIPPAPQPAYADRVEVAAAPNRAAPAIAKGLFDATAPVAPGTTYFNPATGQLVTALAAAEPNAAGQRPSGPQSGASQAGEWKISPMGNLYQTIGQEAVDRAKMDPHTAVLMEGYEANTAKLSRTYDLAKWMLDQEVKAIGHTARGANMNGPTPEGEAAQKAIDALVKSWDPVAGTYRGFDEAKARALFETLDKQAGLTGNGEIFRRRAAGLDEDGYLLPGFSELKLQPNPYRGMTQDQARRQKFLDFHPLATEADYQRTIRDPSYDQGPFYSGFEMNAIASPHWGEGPNIGSGMVGDWAEQNKRGARPRPAELGPAPDFDYANGFVGR